MRTLYITKGGSKISYSNGKLRVKIPNGEAVSYPIQTIEKIYALSRVGFTGRAIRILLTHEIPVYFLTNTAKIIGYLSPTITKNVPLKMTQYDFFLHYPKLQLELAKKTIEAKVKNSYTVMSRWYRARKLSNEPIKRLKEYTLRNLKQINDANELLGFEGYFARRYYEEWAELIPKKWKFKQRNKRPPRDPVNAMLSFGYTILFNSMLTLLLIKGLDPHLGYLHKTKYNHPALASDLMEEFRSVIVDSAVMEIIAKNRLNPIEDFYRKGQGIVMERKAIKLLIHAIEKRFATTYQINDAPYSYRDLLNKKINSYAKVIKEKDAKHFFTFKVK